MNKKIISLIFSFVIFAAVCICGFSVFAAEVTADTYQIYYNSQMATGSKQQIQVVLDSGQKASNPSFSSSNSNVAAVSSTGVVTAKNTGTANITYSPDGKTSRSLSITVKAAPTSITLSATTKTLNEGQSFNLNARVNSSAYQCPIRYTTSNSSVASVSSTGKVTALKEGKVLIQAISENNITVTCTVYVYSNSGISLNKTAAKVAMDYDNVEKIVYGTSVRGRDLEAYLINGTGNNSKTLFCTFAVHGFEDNYAHDGKVLVECANSLIEYFAKNPSYLKDYRLIIVPCANPDGTIDGKNNLRSGSSAYGRCTAAHVDMNRDFISGKFKAQESRALRDLMKKYKMNTFIDFHGWLNSVLGNGTLVDIFRSTNGISRDQTGAYGTSSGYIFGWANANLGAQSALVEFKSPSNCKYLNVAKGIQQVVGSSYHSSSMVVKYTNSIAAVKNVKMTSNTENSVTLKWDAVSGAKGYEVQYYYGGKWNSTYVFNTTSATVKNLCPGTQHPFRVRAFTTSGNTRTYSNYYSSQIYFYTRPEAVTGFKATGRMGDGSAIILGWTPKLNADGYNLYQQINGAWVKIAVLEGGMTSFYRIETTADTMYSFAIEAYNNVSTCTGTRVTCTTYSSISAPDNFSVNAITANKIRAEWTPRPGVGYYIQWSTTSDFSKNISSQFLPANTDTAELTTTQYSKNYYVRIRSCRYYSNENIVGDYSPVLSTKNSLFMPENINVYARGDAGTDLYLRWNKVDDADGYNIYIVDGSKRLLQGTTEDAQFVFENLTPAWEYDVIVESYNSSKNTPSNTFRISAAPAPVSGYDLSAQSQNAFTAKWDVQASHGYYIQWADDKDFTKNVNGEFINGSGSTSKTFTFSNSSAGHYIRVRAWKWFQNSRVYGDFSEPLCTSDCLLYPNGFNVYARGDGGTDVYLSWDDAKNADGYRIYIVNDGNKELLDTVTESDYVFTDLTPAWEYDIFVEAYNNKEVKSSQYRICAAPAPVSGLEINAADTDTYVVSWNVQASHGYYIQWAEDENFTKNVKGEFITGSGSTSKTFDFDDNYYVRVRAWKWYQNSRVYGDFSAPVSTAESLSKPVGFNVYARGDNGTDLYLDWNDVRNADGYRVYITNDGVTRFVDTVTDSNYVFTNLTPAWEYDVTIEAYNSYDVSSSDFRICAAPSAVSNYKMDTADSDTYVFSWDVQASHGYYIQWAEDADFTKNVKGEFINGSGSVSKSINFSNSSAAHYVRVRAWKWYQNSRVYGDFSEPVCVSGNNVAAAD